MRKSVWNEWHRQVVDEIFLTIIASKVVLRLGRVKLGTAVNTWKEHSAAQRRMKQICCMVGKHLLHRNLATHFGLWREHVRKKKRARAVTARIVKHWDQAKLAAAFDGWWGLKFKWRSLSHMDARRFWKW